MSGDYDALVFTSSHGVRGFAALSSRRDCPVFTVGPQTAAVARAAGFTDVREGGGTSASLAKVLKTQAEGLRLLHPCGRVVRRHLPATRLVVYDAVPVQSFSPACLARLADGGFAAILFFSPRGARVFRELFRAAPRPPDALRATKALCLGDAVLRSVQALDWQEAIAAATPDRAGMLALLRREAKNWTKP